MTRATLTLATMDRTVGLGWGAARRLAGGNLFRERTRVRARGINLARACAMSAWLVAAMLLVAPTGVGRPPRYVAYYVDARHGSDANRAPRRSPRGVRWRRRRACRPARTSTSMRTRSSPGRLSCPPRVSRSPATGGPAADHRAGQVRGRGGPGRRRRGAGPPHPPQRGRRLDPGERERTIVEHNLIVDNNRMSVKTRGGRDDSGAFGVLIHGDRGEFHDNVVVG